MRILTHREIAFVSSVIRALSGTAYVITLSCEALKEEFLDAKYTFIDSDH